MFKLYVMLGDRIFSPFQTDFPKGSILLSVGTRVLFGFLMGCIFKIVNKSRYKWAGITYNADALYILPSPKKNPATEDSTGPKRHKITTIGICAVVMEIGGI